MYKVLHDDSAAVRKALFLSNVINTRLSLGLMQAAILSHIQQ